MMRRILLYLILFAPVHVWAQDEYPSVSPTASYTTVDGEEVEDASDGKSAPLVARFMANPSNLGDYTARYEWKIYRPGEEKTPLVHRFEEDIEYTFNESGSFYVQLYATFVLGNDTIAFPEEGEANPFVVSISESQLEFYNAFSPNDDGFNDKLKAKEGYQSIIDFKATVFNRWGQKIHTWTDVSYEWDGRCNGRVIKDGVYFLLVNARGADGKKYNIRQAITVLTKSNKNEQSNETEGSE